MKSDLIHKENEIKAMINLAILMKTEHAEYFTGGETKAYQDISVQISLWRTISSDTVKRFFKFLEMPSHLLSYRSMDILVGWYFREKRNALEKNSLEWFVDFVDDESNVASTLVSEKGFKKIMARVGMLYTEKKPQTKTLEKRSIPVPATNSADTSVTVSGPLPYLDRFVHSFNGRLIVYGPLILDKSLPDDGSERHMFEPNNQFYWKLKDSKDMSLESYVTMVQQTIEKISEKSNVALQRTDKPGRIVLRDPNSGIAVVIRRIEL
ncbi:MAG: hypothetical protein Mars2KO_05130 [Maribacter sp.]